MMKNLGAEVLNLPMDENDAGVDTVRDYLTALLVTMWREKEEFSGKRPFGNSDWDHELYVPLIRAGYVAGSIDDDGFIEFIDSDYANSLIVSAIRSLK